jgi:hypothetical protein
MKKIVLSLAGVLAATAFAPEASAIPAFARQTGLACSSCHFQHYPVLSTTGQEFKVGAYTQLSAKGKFKSDDLSIPDQLNAAILIKARYQKTDGTDAAGTTDGVTTNSGQWNIPDELSLFFGGRIGDNGMVKMGFMNENNMLGGPAGGIIAGLKIPVAIDLDPVVVQVIPYGTDALGMAYGFEQSSTGMTRGVRWAEHRTDISAAQYTGLHQRVQVVSVVLLCCRHNRLADELHLSARCCDSDHRRLGDAHRCGCGERQGLERRRCHQVRNQGYSC